MSAWLTVYCTRPVAHITSDDLAADIAVADMHTNAEVWGIEDEAVVDEALSHLRIERPAQSDDLLFYLRYTGQGEFPIVICLDDSSAGEMLAVLSDDQGVGVSRVRTFLQNTVAVVSLSMKVMHLDGMGIVFASRIAETFASAGDGIIRDQNDEWWTVEDGVPLLVLSRRGLA